uniref:Ubiquitin-like protease family profile domain-containing protein n=1 Tax=Aegilops tauschii TaxID=37682 RepID=M8CGP4_AEGTA
MAAEDAACCRGGAVLQRRRLAEEESEEWRESAASTLTGETENVVICASSCGLWMLNYMEYFTGDGLSGTPEQVHMTDFRTKLAVILVDSEFNDDDIRNRDLDDDETNTDPTDCMIVERPPNKPKASISSSQVELILQSFILSPSVTPTNDDLIDELCLFISMVDDVPMLESEWVKSSQPYPISLNLRQLKNILKNDEYMDADCFNMVVRILGCHDVQLARDVPVHYMDLRFCSMSHYAQVPSHRDGMDIAMLAQLFDSKPDSNEYHISECDTIVLPCDILGLFLLFAFGQHKKVVSILDPFSIPTFGKHILETMANDLNLALQAANPAFKDDILIWGCKVPIVPTNSYGPPFGYLVFNLMHSWHDGTLHFPVPKDDFELRKRFLVHILKYEENEVLNNIPVLERSIIDRIERWTFQRGASSNND